VKQIQLLLSSLTGLFVSCIGRGVWWWVLVQVFLGLNEMTGELMAVKQIKMSQAGDERAMHIASLEREIVLYRKMRHRHIVAYIDMERDEADGSLYVFLEFVSGGSIHR